MIVKIALAISGEQLIEILDELFPNFCVRHSGIQGDPEDTPNICFLNRVTKCSNFLGRASEEIEPERNSCPFLECVYKFFVGALNQLNLSTELVERLSFQCFRVFLNGD